MARIGETSRTRAVDGALELVGDEVAAVGVGADGERLGFQVAQRGGLALAHVGVEGGLVLEAGGWRVRGAAEVRAGGFQREVVDDALVLVQRAVDAGELVGRDDVGRQAPLELAEAVVVGVLEGLEGAHEARRRRR